MPNINPRPKQFNTKITSDISAPIASPVMAGLSNKGPNWANAPLVLSGINNGRISVSTDPFPTSSINSSTVYYTLYDGDIVSLFDINSNFVKEEITMSESKSRGLNITEDSQVLSTITYNFLDRCLNFLIRDTSKIYPFGLVHDSTNRIFVFLLILF